MSVLDYIKPGRENAVSREALHALTRRQDRENREEIEALRRAGYRIMSSSGAKGYWLCGSDGEWLRFEREQVRRAWKCLAPFGGKYAIVQVEQRPGEIHVREHYRRKSGTGQVEGQVRL